MIAVIYRWTLKPGRREDFVKAWGEATRELAAHGSGGSALFDGPDGQVWAIARWPDLASRDRAFKMAATADAGARMADCIAERLDQTILRSIEDLWKPSALRRD